MNITAVIVAVLLASVITAVGGFWLLPMLRRLHFGQTILEIGPKWHQGKQGTPTMGGLMFIIGIPIAVVVAYLFMHASTVGDPMSAIMRARMFYGLVLALLFGAIGFLDDYLKVVKKQNEGLTEKQKMALQILFGAVYLLLLHISGTQSTMVTIPYIGTYDFGVFYYVFAMFAIIALSNAVNFTDGLDGLLSSVTLVLSIGYLIFCYLLGMGEMGIRRRLHRLPVLEPLPRQGIHGRYRLPFYERYGHRAGLWHRAALLCGAVRHYLCYRDRLGGAAALLL